MRVEKSINLPCDAVVLGGRDAPIEGVREVEAVGAALAPFEMARYYHDVAAKVKKAGGNGAIGS